MGKFRRALLSGLPAGLTFIAGCGAPSTAQQQEQAGQADAPPVRHAIMPIGTNLDGLAYWNPGLPMLDLMKSAGRWLPQTDTEYDTGEAVPVDAHGWVTRLPAPGSGARYTSVLVNVLHDNPAAPAHARYVVLYAGTGTLAVVSIGGSALVSETPGRLVVTASDNGGLYLRITATDPGDHLRDIRVVREDMLPLYAAGLTINPDFLAKVAPFATLRFMDWMNTNILFDPAGRPIEGEPAIAVAPLLYWADRATPADRSWGEGSRGVPVETMVEIANRAGAAPWFTMPANASDEYVRGFAIYVRDHLRPDLGVRVEYANEVWNWLFPQARYAKARAQAMFGPDGDWMEWYGVRTAQVGTIWKTVFGEPPRRAAGARRGRVRVVYNTQFAWKGLEASGLDTQHWRDAGGTPLHAVDRIDDYAITGYYDGVMNVETAVPMVQRWWRDRDGGNARAIAALHRRIADFNAPLYLYHGRAAQRRGLALVSYESGFGDYTPPSQHAGETYTRFLAALQRRPEFHVLETQNYRAFQAAGGSLYMNFGIIGTPSKWGNWSALERVTQGSSPRYAALRDWIAANPPWQAGEGTAIAFADARIHHAGGRGETIEGTVHGYDVLVGGMGDDRFVMHGGQGTRIDGGGGDDVLVLSAPRAACRFARLPGGEVRVTGPDGDQTLTGIARVQFAGGSPVPIATILPTATAAH